MVRKTLRLLACLVVGSCAVAAHAADGFYIDVPFVHQAPAYCGPAVLAMVFQHWGVEVDQYALAAPYEPVPKSGLSGRQLKQIAAANGFLAFSFEPDRDSVIIEHLRAGRPIIVALSNDRASNHYVLLVGWDPDRDEWLAHDPARSAYTRIPAMELSHRRARLHRWTLLVVPEQTKAVGRE